MPNVIIFLQDREADRGSALNIYLPPIKWGTLLASINLHMH